MDFRILGPLEVLSAGECVDLGPHKQRELLALLVIHVDRVVPTDRILDELWGDESAGKEKALWVHISRLRSALEPGRAERGQSSVLLTRDHGYMIRSDPSTVDAHRFEAAVADARACVFDDPARAAETLRDAIALWRGAALQDFAYDDFARAEIARLESLRVEAVELRIDADLRLGLSGELVGELEGLVHQHPLRERPVTQLMHALYRAGRQAEALRAFQRYRARIAEDLGIDPSPELCRLEEQILLHDDRLARVNRPARVTVAANPFKGLHPFRESDTQDFFGRDRLSAEILGRVSDGHHMVALVGPSGSGKSSVVRAGVVPALLKGALPGSESWLVASMVPGAHPFAELEAALLRSSIDAPSSLDAQLADPRLGLLRAALRVLPDDDSRVVLVIDQFEELFTLVDDEAERQRFLANVVAALDDARGRVTLIVTLRADSYHRPLAYADFAARLGPAILNVLPLTADELEEAAREPAARHGVTFEPALLTELLTDVIGEPGALPVFQYALTELFDRRTDDRLTLTAYRAMGGARGALSRRADDLYHGLTVDEQEAMRQLFLRLVTITENEQWSRRRVPASEIVAIDVDVVTMESVIAQLDRERFLASDRDHLTGAATVEVAHEALLTEWGRLQTWIEDGRIDIVRRGALDSSVAEWERSGRDSDYLITGKRLAEYERWHTSTTMRLTLAEREFLDASLARRDDEQAIESTRAAREAGLARRARHGWLALAVAVAIAAVVAAAGVVVVLGRGDPPSVALLVMAGPSHIEDLMIDGLERAARDGVVDPVVLTGPYASLSDELAALAEAGTDLVMVADFAFFEDVLDAAATYPDTTWAYIDGPMDDAPSIAFAEHQGAFLAGAAAALTSRTGTIGYLGGFQIEATERFRAGFEAGAMAVAPDIDIVASYIALDFSGFVRDDLAREAAIGMYRGGADVILHAAGSAGAGVFAAAREESEHLGRHLWAIGADSDQYFDVSEQERPHVLTSTIKRFDVAVYEMISDFVDGGLDGGRRELTLADGAVGYSTSGGNVPPNVVAVLDELEDEIVSGALIVPRSPSGRLRRPLTSPVAQDATVTFDGTACRYDGPTQFTTGEVVAFDVVNTTTDDIVFGVESSDVTFVRASVPPGGSSTGYAQLLPGAQTAWCAVWPGAGTDRVTAGILQVAAATGGDGAKPQASVAAADGEQLVRSFHDAYTAFDADEAISYLSDEAVAGTWGTPDDFRTDLAWLEAAGHTESLGNCEVMRDAASGVALRCAYEEHMLYSEERGLGPYGGGIWDITVSDGRIVWASPSPAFMVNGFSEEVWDPFAVWVSTNHPDDALVMYTDGTQSSPRRTVESIQLWERRAREYADAQSS
jgi:basic membrane lipoprotein Med (substrate-binding protein (PBP1-ABC) superfamily)/DNA-binding SARP family transcriptional activator